MSNLLQEKAAHRLLTSILFLFILNLILDLGTDWNYNQKAQELLLTQNRTIASSLLDSGVSEETIAKSLTNTTITPEGSRLIAKLGLYETTAALSTHRTFSFFLALLKPLLFFTLLFTTVLRYLSYQNQLQLKAIEIVSAYTDGIFDTLLPQTEEGVIYRLFASINHMAAALKTGQETEHRTKKFLKNTISDISHQLKTPLTALSMYNEILLEEPDHPDTVRAFAQKSEAAIERMKTLILSLLKIARLDAGSITFQKSPISLTELLNGTLAPLTWRLPTEKKQLLYPQDSPIIIHCDPDWTREALTNILKNALDHTGEGGQVTILAEQSPLETRIHITDNGPGIPPSDLHHIFKRFYRSQAQTTSIPGVGLGLPLAKAITEGQGGTLTVQSPPGSGATFTLTLPNLTKP